MRRLRGIAAETTGGWRTGPAEDATGAGEAAQREARPVDADAGSGGEEAVLLALAQAVEAIFAQPLGVATEPALRAELRALQAARQRLTARADFVTAELTTREKARARVEQPNNPRAGDQAARRVRNQLVDDLNMNHGEVKRAQQVGQRLTFAPTARGAYESGQLTSRKASLLAEALPFVEDPEVAARFEAELVADARRMNDVDFGKRVRQRLAELDAPGSTKAQERRHQRRSGRCSLAFDGFVDLAIRVSCLAGETLMTSVNAFRRPDAPDEHRTTEQATADAVVAMAEAALASGQAPLQHGVRPHLIVTVTEEAVRDRTGVAQTVWSGDLPISGVDDIIDDCGVTRLVHDARGIPVEASEEVRTVPVAVWRGLMDRDGGCIADGCDQRAQWCEVMHLETPYRLGGRLTIATSALGCGYHHKRLDHHGWRITWFDGRPVLHHPDNPPHPPPPRGGKPPEPRPPGGGAPANPTTRHGADPPDPPPPRGGDGRPHGPDPRGDEPPRRPTSRGRDAPPELPPPRGAKARRGSAGPPPRRRDKPPDPPLFGPDEPP